MNTLIVILIILGFFYLQKIFKITYYETKLENRGVEISHVKNMPFYKLWLN